ncbi:MAG: OB-fold nucleic acid binding domain-containing protein [Thermoguttaceae bacterium]|nr:HD domain-containing protein [Thermoguttaceae bacterium]MDO4858462.1 OB-fold nucleic acid binding domain-containing protein [Thermoguttaceae bacterium]
MTRQYINTLKEQEIVNEVFRASNKQLRPNRNGVPYLQIDLSDKTGTLTARLWNANENVYQLFENGDYLHVEGKAQIFQGAMQIIVKRFYKVPAEEIDPEEFVQTSCLCIEKLLTTMNELLETIERPELKALARCYTEDAKFMERFQVLPAGIKHHHAYRGGLLEHVVTMMGLAKQIGDSYDYLDTELLLLGTFLHDTGKTVELECEPEFAYTDEGQLLGHINLGISMLEEKIHQYESTTGEIFPARTALELKHLIASHHGEYEFGSPKLPMTVEAMALHCIDLLDSKLAAFHQLLEEDLNSSSTWTTFNPTLQRKLFKKNP